MEHTYKAPNNFQDRLAKRRPHIHSRLRWKTCAWQLWRMVVHCLSSVRLVRYPPVVWWRGPLVGYAVALLLQVSSPLLFIHVPPDFAFPDVVALLIVLVISLVWGIGPGLIATLSATLLLSTSIISQPAGGFSPLYGLAMALFLLAGTIICLVVCHIEFARTKAESTRQHFYRLFTQGPTNVMVLRGKTHIIEFANSTIHQTLGRANLVGQTVEQALPEMASQRYIERLNRVYTTGVPFIGTEIPLQINRNGNESLEEGYFSFICQPLFDAQGAVEGILVHGVEVTELVRARKRAEELLRQLQAEQQVLSEREQLFRLLTENAQDVIYRYRLSPTFACEYISPSATTVTGYTPEEYYADPCLTLRRLHPGDWPILEGYRHGILSLDDPLIMRAVHKNGNSIWIEQRNKLIYGQDGNVVALEGISRDITMRKQAEETLRASEAMYRTIVHTANEGVWLVDKETRTVFANDRMAAMLGYTTEEMAARRVTDIVFPQYIEAARARTDSNLQGNFEQFDCHFRHKDGSVVYALACTSPVRDYSNNIIGALGMFTDTTERKQLARALAAQVRELEATLESVPDAVLVYDRDGHILRTNTAYRTLIGFDDIPHYADFTIGMKGDMLALRDERGELLPYARWPMLRVLNGEVLTGRNATDIILRTFRGYDVQLNVTGTPTYDQRGNITGGVLVLHDVTERRKLETRTRNTIEALLVLSSELSEELSQSFEKGDPAKIRLDTIAQRLATLIYQASGCEKVGIIVVEPDTGELRSIAFAGITAEQEQQWQQWTSRRALQEQLQELQLDGRLRSDEVLVADLRQPLLDSHSETDGMQKVLLAPMLLGKQLIGVLAVDCGAPENAYIPDYLQLFQAIAKRAALALQRGWLAVERAETHANEMALREANRLMDEFIGIAAHEIRTPLTTIKASVQLANRQLARLAQRKRELPSELAELTDLTCNLLDRAQRQIEMQNRLVGEMLDVSRIRTSYLEMHPKQCNIAHLVTEAVKDQQYLAPGRAITYEHPSEEIFVMGDVDRIKQVINNYLSNALKYSAKHKPVEVTVKAEGNMVRAQVSDEGPGLSEAEQRRVWERFYRVEGVEVSSGSAVGLGLGLHISRTIIEMHGGQVGVNSIPGQGSTFWFTLPQARS